jgi:hypothetical protein
MRRVATAFLLLCVASTLSARPKLATGDDAEISFDGLHRVERTVLDAAWVKPDLDLRPYDSLMLVDAGFAYKAIDNQGRRYNPRSNDTEFYITEENRARLELEMREVFLEEMQDLEHYELVEVPRPGTLMLIVRVIDVVSSVPPVSDCVGRCDIYIRQVGAATLVIELLDAMSGEILVRAADRRAAETQGWPREANAVTVWPEVRRLARFWGRRVVYGLERFESIDDLT